MAIDLDVLLRDPHRASELLDTELSLVQTQLATRQAELAAVGYALAARLARAAEKVGDGDELVDASEIARRFSLKLSFVREQSRLGVLPTIRVGKRYIRYRPSAVAEVLEQRKGARR